MQPFVGLFGGLGGWEIILILALVLILFGAKKLPELAKGLRLGLFNFRKTLDDEATGAGRSLGGIYGKPAAEALTTDNKVAELYNPAVLNQFEAPRRHIDILKFLKKLMSQIRARMRFDNVR